MIKTTKTFGEQIVEELQNQAIRDWFMERLKICAILVFIGAACVYIYRNFP